MTELEKENATEIKGIFYHTIDEAVLYLIECRKQGKSVFVDFDGHKLYSADVTLDSAYIEITGLTKEEYYNAKFELKEAKTNDEKNIIIAKYNEIKEKHQLKNEEIKTVKR